ncbi:hypothetical protein ACHAWF_005930 [Thalassiosira exigua]
MSTSTPRWRWPRRRPLACARVLLLGLLALASFRGGDDKCRDPLAPPARGSGRRARGRAPPRAFARVPTSLPTRLAARGGESDFDGRRHSEEVRAAVLLPRAQGGGERRRRPRAAARPEMWGPFCGFGSFFAPSNHSHPKALSSETLSRLRVGQGTNLRHYFRKVAAHRGLRFEAVEYDLAEIPGSDERATFYVTHLREPVARSISHFKCEFLVVSMRLGFYPALSNTYLPTPLAKSLLPKVCFQRDGAIGRLGGRTRSSRRAMELPAAGGQHHLRPHPGERTQIGHLEPELRPRPDRLHQICQRRSRIRQHGPMRHKLPHTVVRRPLLSLVGSAPPTVEEIQYMVVTDHYPHLLLVESLHTPKRTDEGRWNCRQLVDNATFVPTPENARKLDTWNQQGTRWQKNRRCVIFLCHS